MFMINVFILLNILINYQLSDLKRAKVPIGNYGPL